MGTSIIIVANIYSCCYWFSSIIYDMGDGYMNPMDINAIVIRHIMAYDDEELAYLEGIVNIAKGLSKAEKNRLMHEALG